MKTKIIYALLACLLAACSANPATDTPATKSFTEPEKDWQAKIDATNDAAKAYIIEFGLGRESFYQVPDAFFSNQEDVLFKGTPVYVMDSVSLWTISKEEELASMLTLQTDCAEYFYASQGTVFIETLSINPSLYGKTISLTNTNGIGKGSTHPSSLEKTPKFIQAIESGCPMITISVHTNKQVREVGGARLYFYYDQGHWKECGTDKSFMEGLEFYRQMARDLFHY